VEHVADRGEVLHHVGAAADGADRQAAPDHLAERREIGAARRTSPARRRIRGGSRDHLVEHEQRADPVALARSPCRKPAAGATTPMFAATGSTKTAATCSSSCGTTLYGTTIVFATALVGTPAVPGRPSVATPLPPAASSASVAPWKLP
jgi:hypothetical protein